MTHLLDGSVLVPLMVRSHQSHDRCSRWLDRFLDDGGVAATCPVTEGTLLRIHMLLDPEHSAASAWKSLQEIRSIPGCEMWLGNFSYGEVPHQYLQGHRQITDAWLVELARRKGGKLATLDASLATLYPDVVELIPVIL